MKRNEFVVSEAQSAAVQKMARLIVRYSLTLPAIMALNRCGLWRLSAASSCMSCHRLRRC